MVYTLTKCAIRLLPYALFKATVNMDTMTTTLTLVLNPEISASKLVA